MACAVSTALPLISSVSSDAEAWLIAQPRPVNPTPSITPPRTRSCIVIRSPHRGFAPSCVTRSRPPHARSYAGGGSARGCSRGTGRPSVLAHSTAEMGIPTIGLGIAVAAAATGRRIRCIPTAGKLSSAQSGSESSPPSTRQVLASSRRNRPGNDRYPSNSLATGARREDRLPGTTVCEFLRSGPRARSPQPKIRFTSWRPATRASMSASVV